MRSAFLRSVVLAALLCAAASPARADAPPATVPVKATTTTAIEATAPAIPPDEAGAPAVLEKSPRHAEWIDLPMGDGQPKLRSYVVYPERKDKAPAVVVIQEVYGLTPWLRSVADRLAAEGFIAIAPDYLSGMGPGGGGSDSIATRDETVKATRALEPAEVERRTRIAHEYVAKLPASNGKVATLGFCWGGGQSFAYAAATPPPDAAVVYYGASPDSARILQVKAPVLGHYGEDDARINATIPAAKAALEAKGAFYEANIHPGAGHGFLRQLDGREGANRKAAQAAWPRTIAFLRERLETHGHRH
jgi:carboxymethylenebutenolidase